ncbi:hypothetical protein M422DRAFT_255885 [Sphaerobolus stellatus SS14]|uniref:Uncharacterized protein n=1 Tax=Sphaerobolus stellatus (strain SS14) TaxID=990650 RepID=A0A0C9VRR7_SPHS4|nr:hypothetical protein M422DRAFT_255885 [Sphaerobolus stellatus SS14]
MEVSAEAYRIHYAEAIGSIYSTFAALTALTFDIFVSFHIEVYSTIAIVELESSLTLSALSLLGRRDMERKMVGPESLLLGMPVFGSFRNGTFVERQLWVRASHKLLSTFQLFEAEVVGTPVSDHFWASREFLCSHCHGVIGNTVLGGASAVLLFIFLSALRTKEAMGSKPSVQPEFVLPGCFTIGDSKASTADSLSRFFWIPLLLFESYMFLLTLIRFAQSVRGRGEENMGVMEGRTSLFVAFYRDGTIYFAVIFVSLFFKVLVVNFNTSVVLQSVVSGSWTPVIFSIAGPRLVLNLRAANKEDEEVQVGAGSQPMDDIETMSFVAAENPTSTSITVMQSLDTESNA